MSHQIHCPVCGESIGYSNEICEEATQNCDNCGHEWTIASRKPLVKGLGGWRQRRGY